MDNGELLLQTLLFKGSTRQDLDRILELCQERRIEPNTIIFTERMPAESLYIVKSGTVRISIMAGEGMEKGLLLLEPGDFFGELALIQEGERQVTARAETTVDLLLLTRKDYEALLERDPRIAYRILLAIARLLVLRLKANAEPIKDILRT